MYSQSGATTMPSATVGMIMTTPTTRSFALPSKKVGMYVTTAGARPMTMSGSGKKMITSGRNAIVTATHARYGSITRNAANHVALQSSSGLSPGYTPA